MAELLLKGIKSPTGVEKDDGAAVAEQMGVQVPLQVSR